MTLYYVVPSPHPAAGWSYSIVGQEFDLQGSTVHSVLIPDISCDKNFVAKLAERCTTGQLLVEQLCEVVYDALP